MALLGRTAIAVLALMIAPAAALGDGDVWIDDDGFARFAAADGDVNALSVSATIEPDGDATVVFADSRVPIESEECDGGGADPVTCEGRLSGWSAELGDGNDALVAAGSLEGGGFGGDGDDLLSGSETNEFQEFLEGGPGDDQIFGRGGGDFVVGEAGADMVDGGAGGDLVGDAGGEGSDVLGGGAGFDTIVYTDLDSPADDTFAVDLLAGFGGRTNFAPESDALSGFEDVDTEGLMTNSAADSVTGSDGANTIATGDGADVVNGAAGADSVFAGAGNDAIEARDGANDRVDCAEGVDNVQADQFDELEGCEVVGIVPLRPAGADLDPPGCQIAGVRRTIRRRAFRRGVRPRVDCDEPAVVGLRLLARASLLARAGAARAGDVVLAEAETGAGATVRLKPARRLLRRLPRRRAIRVHLAMDARDQFGNRSIVRKALKVRRARGARRRR